MDENHRHGENQLDELSLQTVFALVQKGNEDSFILLEKFLREHPDQKIPLLKLCVDQVRKERLLKVFQKVQDLLPTSFSDIQALFKKNPRIVELIWDYWKWTPEQAWTLLKTSSKHRTSSKVLDLLTGVLPETAQYLVRYLPSSYSRVLYPWVDLLVRAEDPDFADVLLAWLQGDAWYHEEALSAYRTFFQKYPESIPLVGWTFPVLIAHELFDVHILKDLKLPELPTRAELLYLLSQKNRYIPEHWIPLIQKKIERSRDALLYILALQHPSQFKLRELAISKRYIPLRDILLIFGTPKRKSFQDKLSSLLLELGADVREGRKGWTVSADDLVRTTRTLSFEKMKKRFERMLHRNEIPGDEDVLRALIRKRALRRTPLPDIYERIVNRKKFDALVNRIQKRDELKHSRKREALLKLTRLNLSPIPRTDFVPDDFQLEAVEAVRNGFDVLVCTPTGSGKTWIAEQTMKDILGKGRAFYSTPLRALSYQKLRAFREKYGWENVGVLTGEYRENTDAPIIVGTTEIVRNLLLDKVFFDLLIMDEAHYMGDVERGSAWEEAILLTSKDTRLVLLSATIPNDEEVATWLRSIHRNIQVIKKVKRPVDLKYVTWRKHGPELGLFSRGIHPPLRMLIHELQSLYMTPALVFTGRRDDAMILAREAAEILPKKIRNIPAKTHPLSYLLERGVAPHHAGLSYAFREAVEHLLERGELEFVFCTSSLAHGIDAPVRTTVLYDISPFWERSHLQHALGRAGRRGKDRIGFAVIALPPWNMRKVVRALRAGSEPLTSAFAPHDASIASLLHRYGLEGTLHLAQQSFRSFQGDKRVQAFILRGAARLKKLEFIHPDGSLTERGKKLIRLMHPNACAIVLALERMVHPSALDIALLSAYFVNERPPRRIRTKLRNALIRMFEECADRAGLTELDPRDGARRAWIISEWLHGREQKLRAMVSVEAEGDLERFRIQVIELLRKLEDLKIQAATEALYLLGPIQPI